MLLRARRDWLRDHCAVEKRDEFAARSEFTLLQEGKPALERTSPLIAQHTYWAVFVPSR
jgi:hypothetical protein